MARKDDEQFKWRMEGLSYAYRIMQRYPDPAEGLKALEAEIKLRGYYKVDLNIPTGAITELAKNMRMKTTDGVMRWLVTVIRFILKKEYGWGEKRQDRFIAYLEHQCQCIADKHVRVEDMAAELEGEV